MWSRDEEQSVVKTADGLDILTLKEPNQCSWKKLLQYKVACLQKCGGYYVKIS